MSFDLAVMHVEEPLDAAQAVKIYRSLCEGESDALRPSERISHFYKELVAHYPPLEELSDEEVDNSPWSVSPDISDGAVVVSIVWSRAADMDVYVKDQAAKHELLCYDPQENTVNLPPSLSR